MGSVGGYQKRHADGVKQNNLYIITYENQNGAQVKDKDDFSIKAEVFQSIYKSLIAGLDDKHKKEISN